MATDPTGYAGPHPDLRDQICEMANMLAKDWPEEHGRPPREFLPDDLTILSQRTWEPVKTINSVINGGGVSAVIASADLDGQRYGGLIMAARRPDSDSWGLMSAGFGQRSGDHFAGGDMGGSGHHCIGFYGASPGYLRDVQAVEIEYSDGKIHRAELLEDNCAIVFAPIESWDQKDNSVIIRYVGSDGAVIHEESRWLGEGMGPPESESPA